MTKKLPVSARTAALAGYVPGEQPRRPGLIKLNTNENPYPPSQRVVEAIGRAAADGLERYPAPLADELRDKAAEVYGLEPAQVLAGNGSDELLSICLRACVDAGDTVAYTVPSYSLYSTLAEIAGARVVEIADRSCRSLIDIGAAVSFVCNPNAPFGFGIPLDDLVALAESVGGLVVSDEAYVDFGDSSAIGLVGEIPNLIVLRSFSKSYSMAGVRLGLAFGPAELIAEFAKVKDSYNVSRLACAAGVAALEDQAAMKATVRKVQDTRDRVAHRLRAEGFGVEPSQANFLWVDCGERGGRAMFEKLRAADVLVRYFDRDGLRDGFRVTIGTDAEMDRFLEGLLADPV
jgi:histidinol-phosphate aminotransferase